MLWCVKIHHGERSKGLRGRGIWEATRCSRKEHEIHRLSNPNSNLMGGKS